MTQIDEVLVCGVGGEAPDVEVSPGQRLPLPGRQPRRVGGRGAAPSVVAGREGGGHARQDVPGPRVPAGRG